MKKILLLSLCFVIYILFIQNVIKMYLADVSFAASQDKLLEGSIVSALKDANKAVSLNPREANYYRGRAKVYIYLTSYNDTDTTIEVKKRALQDMQTAYLINSSNLVTIRNLIPLYYFLATKDLILPASGNNIDQDYIKYTEDFYTTVEDYSQNDAGLYTLLAKYEKRLNMQNLYIHSVGKVTELRPDLVQWNDAFR